jgi:hypothetical protein
LREHVRRVTLKDWTQGHTQSVVWELTENMYETLRLLPNLEAVSCSHMLLTTEHLQKLASRSPATTVSFDACTFPYDDTLPYALSAVAVTEHTALDATDGFAGAALANAASGLLSPAHLARATLRMPLTVHILLPLLAELPPFVHLRALELWLPARGAVGWLGTLLGRCPALEELRLVGEAVNADLGELGRGALARLESFEGPPACVRQVLDGRKVRKVTLRTVGVVIGEEEYEVREGWHSAEGVRAGLEGVDGEGVEEAVVYAMAEDAENVEACLRSAFPGLKVLQVLIEDELTGEPLVWEHV